MYFACDLHVDATCVYLLLVNYVNDTILLAITDIVYSILCILTGSGLRFHFSLVFLCFAQYTKHGFALVFCGWDTCNICDAKVHFVLQHINYVVCKYMLRARHYDRLSLPTACPATDFGGSGIHVFIPLLTPVVTS